MLLLCCCLLQEAVTLVTASEPPRTATSVVLGVEAGKLSVHGTGTDGNPFTLQAEEVVEVIFNGSRPAPVPRPAPEEVEVILTCGDTWTGKLGPPAEDGIRLVSPALGDPLVKFGQIRAVLFPANRAFLPVRLPEKADASDLVLTKSGDRAEATLLALSNGGLSYKSKRLDTEITLPLAQAAGVWLVETEAAPKEGSGLLLSAVTRDGSTIRGAVQGLKDGILSITDLYGAAHQIPTSQLSGLFVKNGRVVYLSDLEPKSVDEDANLIRGLVKQPSDLDYPWQRDRNAKGGLLVVGGTQHRKGIGVRAHSALTFSLEGGYQRFQSTFGLDAVSGGLGAVHATVLVDGRPAKEMTLKGSAAPVVLDIDVKGAKELKLVVTWAGYGQSDFADWASARLVR